MKYCRDSRVGTKYTLVPLDPQPDSSSVVTLTRYTLSLVVNPKYLRRISWLDGSGDNIDIVEYIGKHVIGAPYGLCKQPSDEQPYVRTPHDTMQQAASMGVQMHVKLAYNKLITKLDVDDAPRNPAVVRMRAEWSEWRRALQHVQRQNRCGCQLVT